MTQTNYMVLGLPKDSEPKFEMADAKVFADWDEAFDYFNQLIALCSKQVFKQPKSPQPLRVALNVYDVELWVLRRTDELLTDKQ